MSALSIRIAPTHASQPEPAARPLDTSQRWDSAFDNSGLDPVVSVFMTRPAYIRVCVHACSASIEVGGALVGDWCMDRKTGEQFVIVKHVLPARFTRQGAVYLTFTQDSIVDLHDQIEKRFPGERIVGWYHTHPQMGVFLSHYDTWLHSHFFPEPWQVALVVEPFSSVAGFFIRQPDGSLDPTRYFGFYEMDGANGHSIVRWHNLQRIDPPPKPAEPPARESRSGEEKPTGIPPADPRPRVEIKPRGEAPRETKAQPAEPRPRVELKPREETPRETKAQPAEPRPRVELKPREETPSETKSQGSESRPRVEIKPRDNRLQNESKGGKSL
jgi:proteasome lid subunit RPN8/RPN11